MQAEHKLYPGRMSQSHILYQILPVIQILKPPKASL